MTSTKSSQFHGIEAVEQYELPLGVTLRVEWAVLPDGRIAALLTAQGESTPDVASVAIRPMGDRVLVYKLSAGEPTRKRPDGKLMITHQSPRILTLNV